MPRIKTTAIAAGLSIAMAAGILAACGGSNGHPATVSLSAQDALATKTPIKHVVVIFGENISYDHYFGTYPNASNPEGEPVFTALTGTPAANNYTANASLLTANPNYTNTANGTGASNPFRLDRSQACTASMNHNYGPEQQAFDNLAMDLFPKYTGRAGAIGSATYATTGLVMGYFDGNTVTGLWNYAQHFAMNDNSFNTQFGPSTPGALNLISGQTNGATAALSSSTTPAAAAVTSGYTVADGQAGYTVIGDPDPTGDACSSTTNATVSMSGKNIGDVLNASNITWGWFEGGFDRTKTNPNGTTGCQRSSYSSVVGGYKSDYVPHHEPFQYYASTANPTHARPTSTAMIGYTDAANHQYDTDDFFTAVAAGNFPSVSFLKAPAIQDAHAGNSDPLDEQVFVTTVINFLQKQTDWSSTAVILAYDDSDGWYDHAYQIVNPSFSTLDSLNGTSTCGSGSPLNGVNGSPVNGRCGYGPRLPLLVVSPYAKSNYIDHTLTDQTSVLRFIEDNWLSGQRIGQGSFDAKAGTIENMFDFSNNGATQKLFLDTGTGLQVSS
ncbi:phospholipase C [Robbsia andropogonis]|uniref:phospholipase C n=1 Tax=Robbsia andropogonis TaxID=28092 RepID=UPI00389A9E3F